MKWVGEGRDRSHYWYSLQIFIKEWFICLVSLFSTSFFNMLLQKKALQDPIQPGTWLLSYFSHGDKMEMTGKKLSSPFPCDRSTYEGLPFISRKTRIEEKLIDLFFSNFLATIPLNPYEVIRVVAYWVSFSRKKKVIFLTEISLHSSYYPSL